MRSLSKKCLICFVVSFFATAAIAGPFLVSDPPLLPSGVQYYEIYKDGVLIADNVQAQPDGSLRFDLIGTAPGIYTFKATACNDIWGCSDFSDPCQSPAAALQPNGLRMVKE